MEIALLGWTQCYPVKLFPECFIQSVHFWHAHFKHDNSSTVVIHQHASAAVLFHPLVLRCTHTHGARRATGLSFSSGIQRLCRAEASSAGLLSDHHPPTEPFAYTSKRQNCTARVFSQLQETVTRCPLCCGGITLQWELGAWPVHLKSFSCLTAYEVFTQRQPQTAGGNCSVVLFNEQSEERFKCVVCQAGFTEPFGISHPV